MKRLLLCNLPAEGKAGEWGSGRWGESVLSSSGLYGGGRTMIRDVRGFLCGWEGRR